MFKSIHLNCCQILAERQSHNSSVHTHIHGCNTFPLPPPHSISELLRYWERSRSSLQFLPFHRTGSRQLSSSAAQGFGCPGVTLSLSSVTDYGGFIPRDSVCFHQCKMLETDQKKVLMPLEYLILHAENCRNLLKLPLSCFIRLPLVIATVINISVF